jgi:hypothetical protein
MANTAVKGTQAQPTLRMWLVSFIVVSAVMAGAGLLLAGAEQGAARPWAGVAFLVSLSLAIVVGASKTSSA